MVLTHLTKHNDTWYKILREVPIHNFADKQGNIHMDILKEWRDYVGGDHVLRTQTHFQICETIQEAQIIEEYGG